MSLKEFKPSPNTYRSIEDLREMCRKDSVMKALKACRQQNISFSQLGEELVKGFRKLRFSKNSGTILSIYNEFGVIGPFSILELLADLAARKDYPALLKQAFRFKVYDELKDDIEAAITWHEDKGTPDATAWRIKFESLHNNSIY